MHLKRTSASPDAKFFVLLMAATAVAYALLQNGQWVPGGGDETFYLLLARNLATGGGYEYLGSPVRLVPPGWPVVLAGAMLISPSFLLLDLLPMLLTLAAAGIWYWVVRRFAPPWKAFCVVTVVAILFHWHRATYHLLSEGLFYFLFALSVLLALQVSEGRNPKWRLPTLILLSASLVAVRWAGLLALPVICGALVSGQKRIRVNLQWLGVSLCGLSAAGTFMCISWALGTVEPGGRKHRIPHFATAGGSLTEITKWLGTGSEPRDAADASVDATASQPSESVSAGPAMPVARYVQKRHPLLGSAPIMKNIAASGNWLSRLFWPPAEISKALKSLNIVTNLVGWVLLGFLMLHLVSESRSRQWLWLGVFLYCAALFARWGEPNGRYLAPIAALILLGIWQGMEKVGSLSLSGANATAGKTTKKAAKALAVLFIASVAVCNLAIWAVNVRVARAADFYGACLAGEMKPLILAANWLRERGVRDRDFAINDRYVNLGRQRDNRFAFNALYLLTNRVARIVPRSVCADRPNEKLLQWAKQHGVKYYVCRLPTLPWRLWHFRLGWIQQKLTGKPLDKPSPYFELYELRDGRFVKINLPDRPVKVPRVPGL